MRVLNYRHSQTNMPQEFLFQFFNRHFQEIGYESDFRPAEPYIPRIRPGAATPALQTLKVQPSRIPGSFNIAEIHSNYFTTEWD
jgi:hypothetical protein